MSQPKLSVSRTVGMEELLNDPTICKNLFRSEDSLRKVICQIQLDIANDENRDTVGPTIIALKKVLDSLMLFSAKGGAIIQEETEREKKTK